MASGHPASTGPCLPTYNWGYTYSIANLLTGIDRKLWLMLFHGTIKSDVFPIDYSNTVANWNGARPGFFVPNYCLFGHYLPIFASSMSGRGLHDNGWPIINTWFRSWWSPDLKNDGQRCQNVKGAVPTGYTPQTWQHPLDAKLLLKLEIFRYPLVN